jgi:uncharacterized membrane protein
MRKWMPAVLIAIGYIASASVWPRLPEMVEPGLGALLPFETTSGEPLSREFLAFLVPTTALGTWLLFLGLTSRRGFVMSRALFGRWAPRNVLEPEAIDRFRSTFDLVLALVIAFIVVLHVQLLALAVDGPDWIIHVLAFIIGLGLAVTGNVMPRVRPNPIMGVRTRATLNDPVLWARMHRLFGSLLFASGVLVMLLAVVAVRYALVGFAGSLLVSSFVVFVALLRSPNRTATGTVLVVLMLIGNGPVISLLT